MEPSPDICFIASHTACGHHFYNFSLMLKEKKIPHTIIAGDTALNILETKNVSVQNMLAGRTVDKITDLTKNEMIKLAQTIADKCQSALCVWVDGRQPAMEHILAALKDKAPTVLRILYHDNPDNYVPGESEEYGENLERLAKLADWVVHANPALLNTPIYQKEGIPWSFQGERATSGFFFLSDIMSVKMKRNNGENATQRAHFLSQHKLQEKNQMLAVFVGECNQPYFSEALPNFLKLLQKASHEINLSELIILYQQDPQAKGENIDGKLIQQVLNETPEFPKFIISSMSTLEALVFADMVFYHRTEDAIKFAMLGLNAMQVGPKFEDLALRNGLAVNVSDSQIFTTTINHFALNLKLTSEQQKLAVKLSGYRGTWPIHLTRILENIDQNKVYSSRQNPLGS